MSASQTKQISSLSILTRSSMVRTLTLASSLSRVTSTQSDKSPTLTTKSLGI